MGLTHITIYIRESRQMKLKPAQIKKLARLILDKLEQQNLINIRTTRDQITQKIESILLADVQMEDEIEKEARAMMEKYRAQVQSGEIDYQKMYGMVKKELMKKKKFIP